jgi:soluble lytic murein transglycosylase
MRKLVWSRPEMVIQSYSKAIKQLSLTGEQKQILVRDIALSLAVDDHSEANTWLEHALTLKPDKELLRWQIATKVRHQDWQGVLDSIAQAFQSNSAEAIYTYWQG